MTGRQALALIDVVLAVQVVSSVVALCLVGVGLLEGEPAVGHVGAGVSLGIAGLCMVVVERRKRRDRAREAARRLQGLQP